MFKILLVALGGALGSVSRYGLATAVQRWSGALFPYGTLSVNLLGCLLIGLLGGLADVRGVLSSEARIFLLIGFLGGFTTFSSFGYENYKLLQDGQLMATLMNALAQVVVGIAAVWAGMALARYF